MQIFQDKAREGWILNPFKKKKKAAAVQTGNWNDKT